MVRAFLAGLFGLLIGSFLNVCIHRWPQDLSVVRPRSNCPSCGHQIAWFDNIPLVSFLILRSRCRYCEARISWRYPIVELLTGAAFFYFVWHLGLTPMTGKYCLFAALLIGLIFSDLETLLLPDQFTIGGLVIAVILSPFVPVPDSTFHAINAVLGLGLGPYAVSFGEAALGAVVPAGALWLGGWLFEKLRHKEGLGFGDVKMIAMIGAFLGIRGTLLTIILGSITGSVVGLIYIKATRKDSASYQLPFGSFLGAAAFVAAIQGQRLIGWYAEKL